MFEETIFPPIVKEAWVEKSYVGGFDFWFEKNDLMVRCPHCNSIFCLEPNILNEKILRMGIRNQGYYFAQLIKSKCIGCRDALMYR